MDLLAVAKPWTYWLAFPIVAISILGVLSLFLRYLLKVVAAKYPKQ
ncbi:MAG: hypothetical protein M3159_06270 [Actinomycetota bacterium]|nr:hypothetical protein [Actinomycetota bacterium]